jgi:transcriptional regulator with XRE-family HTH domain
MWLRDNPKGMMAAQATPPTFNGPAFAKWLRRWKESENLGWGDIAERSGLHESTLNLLARGKPQKAAQNRGQTEINPGITTIARLAYGLGLEFGYVASKAGIQGGGGDRWEHFGTAERDLLTKALLGLTADDPAEQATRDRLLHQLDPHLTQEVTA